MVGHLDFLVAAHRGTARLAQTAVAAERQAAASLANLRRTLADNAASALHSPPADSELPAELLEAVTASANDLRAVGLEVGRLDTAHRDLAAAFLLAASPPSPRGAPPG